MARVHFRNMLAAAFMILTSSSAISATGYVTANVDAVMLDDVSFGGCMIKLSTDINDTLPACGENWVTLDCLAAFPGNTKSNAQTKLSLAQLALVTNRQVYVGATDSRKANGYCFATLLQVDR